MLCGCGIRGHSGGGGSAVLGVPLGSTFHPILKGRDQTRVSAFGCSVVLWTNLVFTFGSFCRGLLGAGAWEPDFCPRRGRAPEAEQRGEVALLYTVHRRTLMFL